MLTIEEINKLPFLFIVGRARSGTTLLQTMLDANPHVMLPLESRLIIFLKKKYFPIKVWKATYVDEFINDLYKEKAFSSSWNVNREELQKTIHSFPLNKLSFQVICKIVYLSYPSPFEKTTILLLGDKNPVYSKFIKEIAEVFPQAKFIHLIRDYRDNILSNREAFARKDISLLAHSWTTSNICIDKFKAQNKNLFYTLRYEDLVVLPEKYIREICEFTAIPFYPEMMQTHTKMKEKYGETKQQNIIKLHSNIISPINTQQIDKWKKKLSAEEIALADYICGHFAKQYNYLTVSNKKGITFLVKSLLGKYHLRFDDFIINTYYKLPIYVRDIITGFSKKLYHWFGYSNYYNQTDFMFNRQE